MIVKKLNVKKDNESCSFCDKGVLSSGGMNLLYPYDEIFQFNRDENGIMVNICTDCLLELGEKVCILTDK